MSSPRTHAGAERIEIWRDHADCRCASPFTHDSHNMGQLASVISESVRSVPKRKPPLMVQQILIFAHRYLAQQHAERYSFYFDMWFLSGIAVGIAVPSTTTQFQLSNLIIGLTATLSALRIFKPSVCREAFTNTSTAAYFLGKILAYLPRLAFMPFIGTLTQAAWPGIPFVKLYEIFPVRSFRAQRSVCSSPWLWMKSQVKCAQLSSFCFRLSSMASSPP